MIAMKSLRFSLGLFLAMAIVASLPAEEGNITPDLTKIADTTTWRLIDAEAELVHDGGRSHVRLATASRERQGGGNAGLALVEGLEFNEGVIEVDLKGRNQRQNSFLGVTFHALNGDTLEAVYFRPFNFQADPPYRTRAVQYISWPDHTWEKLRQDTPGVYENAVNPVPNPEDWFHARIEVSSGKVSVFVNSSEQPSLVVDRLTDREDGGVGLWADVSDGAFANLKIIPR